MNHIHLVILFKDNKFQMAYVNMRVAKPSNLESGEMNNKY